MLFNKKFYFINYKLFIIIIFSKIFFYFIINFYSMLFQ